MTVDPANLWPAVGPMLHARKVEAQRRWLEEMAAAFPELNLTPWPKRRSSKRKPPPGVYDAQEQDG